MCAGFCLLWPPAWSCEVQASKPSPAPLTAVHLLHAGNLIRTPDGRLCILDFGLMCRIDDNIKFGMIEAVSHLVRRDYGAIVQVCLLGAQSHTVPETC